MSDIAWLPADRAPENAADIEAEIDSVAPGGVVRMSLTDTGWRVRALLPGAMCGRGASASERDVSEKVAEVLGSFDCPVVSR